MDYKTVDELLALLETRGLQLGDREHARHCLCTIGHNRLTGFYELFYQEPKIFDVSIPATLDDVFHLYSFDRRLRLLVLGPLEKIEVALRALIIKEVGDYLLREHHGDVEIDLFSPELYDLSTSQNQRNLKIAQKGCRAGAWANWNGPFARTPQSKHMGEELREEAFRTYYENLRPWKVLQTASFGPLTHIFSILRKEIAYPISTRFALPRVVLTTALYGLKELRNACAHHEPIWNWNARKRSVSLLFPKAYIQAAGVTEKNEYKLYPYCAIIHMLLGFVSFGKSTWHRRLKKLVNEYSTMYSSSMGFPEDWQTMPFWCVSDVAKAAGYEKLRTRVRIQANGL